MSSKLSQLQSFWNWKMRASQGRKSGRHQMGHMASMFLTCGVGQPTLFKYIIHCCYPMRFSIFSYTKSSCLFGLPSRSLDKCTAMYFLLLNYHNWANLYKRWGKERAGRRHWVYKIQTHAWLISSWFCSGNPNLNLPEVFPIQLSIPRSSHQPEVVQRILLLTGSLYILMMSCFTPWRVGCAHGEGSSQWRFRSKPIREHLGKVQTESQYGWDSQCN